uniref:Peroxidasin homolog n=1 Tax=Dermatophagoides pteronyssinus TaxID=6956 RepID=A0A6P6YFB9_DERPT|nr:peroxidasin homolog [Dermatophagoides pteronyssinus]
MFNFDLILLFCLLLFKFTSATSPKLIEFKSQITQKNGTKLTIVCVIQEGTKPFQFEWRFNDQQLLKSSIASDYRIDSFTDDQSQLTIPKLDQKHSGTYSCLARNDFGFDRQSTRLTVTGLRIFIIHQYVAQMSL